MAVVVYPAPTPAGTNNIGDVDVLTLPALVAGTANIGDVDVLTLPAVPAGNNNIGDVDVVTLPALVAGTANIGDVDVLTLPALPAGSNNIGTVDAIGDVAHDAADSGDPMKVGGRASTAVPSAVSADGDRVNAWFSRNGAQVVVLADLNGYASNGLTPTATVGSSAGNVNVVRTTQTAIVSNTSLVSAPGASLSIYVTDISVGNSGSALSVITLKDGTTAKFDFPCAASGGGAVTNLVTPWKLTANTALQYDTTVASTTMYITVNYYVAA